ncbi:MAG TPA: uL13 family ribosomal protein [Fluviicola sp.]|nr:uL13 family ribosomal protein [Fluviicola sp.]
MKRNPARVIEKAIIGMLPKKTLGRQLYSNVKVYAGSEHKHDAQKPEAINLNAIK